MDRHELKAMVVRIVLAEANEAELHINEIAENDNLLEIFDSMSIVTLIMETESEVSRVFGKYIPLANEHTFDREKSPFVSMANWLKFIYENVGINNE